MSFRRVILVGVFFTTAATDSATWIQLQSMLKKSPPERDWGGDALCVDCSWQRGAGFIQAAFRFTFPSFAPAYLVPRVSLQVQTQRKTHRFASR